MIALLFASTLAWAAAPAWAQGEPARFVVTDESVEVTDGTTMFYLVREFYPLRKNDWLDVAHDLALANPEAFRNGDPGALIVGREIFLIDYGEGIEGRPSAAPKASEREQASSPAPTDTAADAGADAQAPAARPAAQPAAAIADPVPIGQITRMRGEPTAVDADNRSRRLRRSGKVFRGDTLITDDDAQMSLLMTDGAVLHLRADSRLVFEKYGSSSADVASAAVITLPRGALRVVTGEAAATGTASTVINTAVATIGVKSADLALRICSEGGCRVEDMSVPIADGLYCAVADGAVSLSNNTGETIVERGNVLRVRDADGKPQEAPEAIGAAYTKLELTELDLQPDEPLGFWAWFKERFF